MQAEGAKARKNVNANGQSRSAARLRSLPVFWPTSDRHVVTVLFADLRDSTTLAEQLPIETMAKLLNTYLAALARPILVQRGMLMKFLGDGVLAVLGGRGDRTHGALPAVRAVRKMRLAVCRLNQAWTARGLPSVGFGVGIHTGEAVFTALGLAEQADYTVIGDTVNTAARLSGLCRSFDVDVVISEATAARLGSAVPLRVLGPVTVRGKRQPMQVYTLE